MKGTVALAFPLLLAANAASAAYQDRGGYVDAYYMPSAKQEVNRNSAPDDNTSGHGFGAHAIVPLTPLFVVTGEYQRATYDNFNTDQFRVGGGVQSSPDIARLIAYAEYVNIKLDGENRSSGFGLHLRGTYDVMPALNLFGEVGYVNVSVNGSGSDGPEFLAGASYAFTPLIGVFADYRWTRIATNNEDKQTLQDVRTGVRIYLTH